MINKFENETAPLNEIERSAAAINAVADALNMQMAENMGKQV